MKKIVAFVLLSSILLPNVGCIADTADAQDEGGQQPERTGKAREEFAPAVAAALMAAAAAITAAILAGQQKAPPPPIYRPSPNPGSYPDEEDLPRLPDPRDASRWLDHNKSPRR